MRRVPNGFILLCSIMALLLAGGLPMLAQAPQPAPGKAAATKPAPAKAQASGQLKASGIQVQQIQADEVKLPAEFQIALYENLIEQLNQTYKFEHVYRDGDHNAAATPDLIILHCTVTGFKQGSARARQVTTVAGASDIKVHVQFADKSGKSLLEKDVDGRVRMFGENLRATFDFGKKVAEVVRQNFIMSTRVTP
jgi:hypothetical protein